MNNINIVTEYIKLEQFLKLSAITGSGGEAKTFILENEIFVNGDLEKRRGRKLRHGDTIEIYDEIYTIVQVGESE